MNTARLIYISRAKVNGQALSHSLKHIVSGLCSVSFYGQNCFFQCLDGTVQRIDQFVAELNHIAERFDVRILAWHTSCQPIAFEGATTHYLSSLQKIPETLKKYGFQDLDTAFLQDAIYLFQHDNRSIA